MESNSQCRNCYQQSKLLVLDEFVTAKSQLPVKLAPNFEKALTFAFYSPIVRAVEETGNGWRAASIADQALTRRLPPVESSEP
jgi:hypothetical protein